ncbi:MAG: sugar phosphate isomerase/epimerase [Clostridia bacterium]|nr:sugar phosphate isomerase/epimerase [Clostridia bacterium]
MRIGAQLFTLREMTQTLDGFAEALKRVADIGYTAVQVSATCPFEAEWLRDELAKNGLRCVLTHTPVPRLTGETEKVIAEHDVFGCRCVGLGWWAWKDGTGMGREDFERLFPPVMRRLREGGKLFMYHNHDQEFQHTEGRPILQRLAETYAPDELGFTLDTFWVQAGGGDPAQWLERLAGRIPVIHLKDYAYGRKMAPVGEGNINFDRVFEKAEAGGTEWMLVEQDDCNGEDPLDCLRRSFDYLRSRGFE